MEAGLIRVVAPKARPEIAQGEALGTSNATRVARRHFATVSLSFVMTTLWDYPLGLS